MNATPPVVGIVMGSQSDWKIMRHASETLEALGVAFECRVLSAHRTPDRLAAYASSARERGLKVIIAGAGMSAALPGAVAAHTPLPVFGVPLESGRLGGLDSLLSMTQMPRGVPVGTVAVGKPGAVNAALLAVAVLALGDQGLAKALDDWRAQQSAAGDEIPADEA